MSWKFTEDEDDRACQNFGCDNAQLVQQQQSLVSFSQEFCLLVLL